MTPPLIEVPTPNALLAVPLRFIVADDDQSISRLIVRVITSLYPDVVITPVANGEEGLREYERHGADFVVTDRHMPEMDGLTLIHAIRAHEVAIPILLTSGVADRETDATSVDATHFLVKPFTLSQLSAALILLLPVPPALIAVLPVLPALVAVLPVLPDKIYHFIIADTRIWVQEALCGLILAAYPVATIRSVSTASDILADYAQFGADLIILSNTLAPSDMHETLTRIRGANQTIPVIVFSADPAVGATIVQDDTTSFLENPFLYKGLGEMIAKMVSA